MRLFKEILRVENESFWGKLRFENENPQEEMRLRIRLFNFKMGGLIETESAFLCDS